MTACITRISTRGTPALPLINAPERPILRELAHQVAEIAAAPRQAQRRALWIRQHRLEPTRPLFVCYPEHAWRELIPDSLIRCCSPLARTYEWSLRHLIYRRDHIHDDYVTDATVPVPLVYRTTGWGLDVQSRRPGPATTPGTDFAYNDFSLIRILNEFRNPFGQDCSTSRAYHPPLRHPDQLDQLTPPRIEVDLPQSTAYCHALQDTLGDILDVRLTPAVLLNCSLIGTLNSLRGMEQLMIDLIDRPAWVHRAMQFLTDATLSQMNQLTENNSLALNNDNQYLQGGGVSCTDQLPAGDYDGRHVRFRDLWGHATIQSAPHLSPAMQEQFIFAYQRQLLNHYGLVCYGCCEPIHAGNLPSILRLPNLRKLIVSPWSDLPAVSAALTDRYVLAWKPNPAQIAPNYDLRASEKHIRQTLRQTSANIVQIILKDIHTTQQQPERIDQFTHMVSALIGAD